MASTQEIFRRIKSVTSTRKVTRAMQMVSAAKMRKSQTATLNSRSYAELAWELIYSLYSFELGELTEIAAEENENEDPYIELRSKLAKLIVPNPKATKICVIVISTNRGLVGSFNANLFISLRKLEQAEGVENIEYIVLGKKAADIAARLRRNLVANYEKPDVTPSSEIAYPIARDVSNKFAAGEYKSVYVVFNRFISTLSQQVEVKQLLPFMVPDLAEKKDSAKVKIEYVFEPSPVKVLEHLLPRIFESQLYQTMLESNASEHSARMVMMKNATESAGDIISDLTLTFNQLRQNKITTELSEITAGKIALEGQV